MLFAIEREGYWPSLILGNLKEVVAMTCPKKRYQGVGQPTLNGILSGIPKIEETKKPNRINQLGYIDGGGGGI
ncbi:hypothetical protein [Aeromonas jandaei]|uniref:hypothetical protein n=1 Tax=Aeromonas jandaei TaxID=650 RepID=UPI001ADDA547|nr:hypothetical protein [Aeromonas jandaei]